VLVVSSIISDEREVKSFDFLPIIHSMSGYRAEPRTALFAMAEVSWEDQNGTPHDEPAKFEDRSLSGACIRVKTAIRIGSLVKIKWRWEAFSGVAMYCLPDRGEYILGIRRNGKAHVQSSPVRTDPLQESVGSIVQPVSAEKIQSGPKQQEDNSNEIPASPKTDSIPIVGSPIAPAVAPQGVVGQGMGSQDSPPLSQPKKFDAPKGTELQTGLASSGKERTRTSTKWLDSALGRQKQDAPNGKITGVKVTVDRARAEASPAGKVYAEGAPADRSPSSTGGTAHAKPLGDLQSIEDVYRGAGIMNPRMGYSVGKVVEMVNSDHMRGLSNDAKRAAVFMALDAAGISIDEILRDAALRQEALSAYESGQRKQFEVYWTRKIEGNAQIQAEMDRVTAQYLERINRTQEEVAEENSAFARWQTMKQREAELISEAVGLCSKPSPTVPASEPVMALSGAGAIVKTS
jgi:hypothetical protein